MYIAPSLVDLVALGDRIQDRTLYKAVQARIKSLGAAAAAVRRRQLGQVPHCTAHPVERWPCYYHQTNPQVYTTCSASGALTVSPMDAEAGATFDQLPMRLKKRLFNDVLGALGC